MKPVIEVSHATVIRGQLAILRDFNWQVGPGQNWVLFGPNGAGKTTVLNLITGYLWTTEGSVSVLGETLGHVDVRELRVGIAVVSDWMRGSINEQLTGFQVLITGARAHLNLFEPPSMAERKRASEIAELTAIVSLLEKTFAVMSTGERQRLLIGRALMSDPRIVILDEPCAGLDLAGREFVLRTIESIAAMNHSPTMLLTTHHVEEVTNAFTHAMLIKNGVAFAEGPIRAAFSSRNMSALFDMKLLLSRKNGRWSATAPVS